MTRRSRPELRPPRERSSPFCFSSKRPINRGIVGQRIAAAVLAHHLDISADRAFKLYVQGRDLDPTWEEVGETLLKNQRDSAASLGSSRPALGPQLVRSEFHSQPAAASPSPQATLEEINLRTERESDVS
jgi:hypothetical protein